MRRDSLIYPEVMYDPEQFSDRFMKITLKQPNIFCADMMARVRVTLPYYRTIESETVYAAYTETAHTPVALFTLE